MLKRFFLSLALAAGLISSANAAGTVPGFSLQRMISSTGAPLVGCQLYIIQAGTTSTPQTAYQDSGLTIPLPNPISCDGNGWLPQFFVADGSIKLRLTDSSGNQQLVADNILVVGPSGGGGGGSTVDPTTVLQTGDMKIVYGTGPISGFVRANGRTIGSATSGASERANADTQALFQYLWGADSSLAVSGGRGASAAADWAANKTITLPDFRGRAIAGLDDMGNTAAGRLTSTYFGTSATVLGAVGGSQSHTLTAAETAVLSGTVPSQIIGFSFSTNSHANGNLGPFTVVDNIAPTGSFPNQMNLGIPAQNITVNSGGGAAHAIVPPEILTTIYIKL